MFIFYSTRKQNKHQNRFTFYNLSTGNPTRDPISDARERNSSISVSVRLQPTAPANSDACSAFFAPGIGITFPWQISQFNTTWI